MQFAIRTRAMLFSAFALCGGLVAGCSTSSNAPQPTVTVTVTVPASIPSTDAATKQALAYLQAPKRSAEFENLIPRAGVLIAQDLQSGKFGSVTRYNEEKTPLTPDYIGWGGIEATNRAAFAWVYWNKSSIDYTKPITQIMITAANTKPDTSVNVFAPDTGAKSTDILGSYWTEGYYLGPGFTEVIDANGISNPASAYTPQSGFYSPTSLSELQGDDAAAMKILAADLSARYGDSWKD